MANQLSKEEVNMLFEFVERQNVVYKDVQYEIVDHLASAIEEEQSSDASLSFNSALQKVYGRFPITGFAMMILAKEKALDTYWKRRFFKAFLGCFTYPKVAFTLLISSLIFFSLDYGDAMAARIFYYIKLSSLVLTSIYICTTSFVMNEGHNNYLFTKTYLKVLTVVFIAIFYVRIDLFFNAESSLHDTNLSTIQCVVLTIYFSLAYYLIYAFGFAFPKILEQDVIDKYRHLNINFT